MAKSFNLADLFEVVADAAPAREALVVGDKRLTYGDLDERANRLAHVLQARGVGAGQHVGLQLVNGNEYIEGMLAAFKLRAVPVNVNYRYVEGELRHLFDDADLVALVVHRQFVPRVAAVVSDVPSIETYLVVDDSSGPTTTLAGELDYESALAAAPPARDFAERSADDLYCVYTGGTTGMPKGVIWRHEDIFFAAMGGGDPFQMGNWVSTPEELAERLPETGAVALPIPPFMHASAHWLAFHQLFTGGKIVLLPDGRFEPASVWDLVDREKVNTLVIVGDAIGRPLLDELAKEPQRWDTSSLIAIGSGGAVLSPATKDQINALLPGRIIADTFGSSETGTVGGFKDMRVGDAVDVLGEDHQPVARDGTQRGLLARSGHVPLRYYNDPEKTAKTFVETGGRRWVLPGDMATVSDDGTITMLGRGSVSINTGGEKVFPEEVESALKSHAAVLDAVVVGVPDDRWGERVAALVRLRDQGADVGAEELQQHAREHLAGYKIPREVVVVDHIERSPSGKADYRWAKDRALAELGIQA